MQEIVIKNQHRGRVANIQEVAAELHRIAKANKGQITPEAVVRNAESSRSPIHDCFTWDDTEAAKRYRLVEAASLIRSVKVIVETHPQDKPLEVRAFVNVAVCGDEDEGEPKETCYVPLKVALKVDDYRQQMLDNAAKELSSFRRKYSILKELATVLDAADAFVQTRMTL
jgi:hypothetical protein